MKPAVKKTETKKQETTKATKVAVPTLRDFKAMQESHRNAKLINKSVGGCLQWIASFNPVYKDLAIICITNKAIYEFIKSQAKPNVKTRLFNAYSITMLLRKHEAKIIL